MGGITTQKQERFVQTEMNIVLGKNGGYVLSSLVSRLISVGRQVGRQASRQAGRQAGKQAGSEMKFFVIQKLQFSEF